MHSVESLIVNGFYNMVHIHVHEKILSLVYLSDGGREERVQAEVQSRRAKPTELKLTVGKSVIVAHANPGHLHIQGANIRGQMCPQTETQA